jgi:hypothetical protein
VLVTGDALCAWLAYLLAFVLRVAVPLPLTQDYLPMLRFAEVHHHWLEMLAAQLGALYSSASTRRAPWPDPAITQGALVRDAPGAAPGRGVLLPAGPAVPALDLWCSPASTRLLVAWRGPAVAWDAIPGGAC